MKQIPIMFLSRNKYNNKLIRFSIKKFPDFAGIYFRRFAYFQVIHGTNFRRFVKTLPNPQKSIH